MLCIIKAATIGCLIAKKLRQGGSKILFNYHRAAYRQSTACKTRNMTDVQVRFVCEIVRKDIWKEGEMVLDCKDNLMEDGNGS